MALEILARALSLPRVCAMDSSPNPGMHRLCPYIHLSVICLAPEEPTCLGS